MFDSLKSDLRTRKGQEYIDHVRSLMKEFCFTINLHTGDDRVWFGSHTVTINRNTAFNFFTRDVQDDPGLEPFPVIRSERNETTVIKVHPYPEDPSANYGVTAFHLAAPEFNRVMDSMNKIAHEFSDLRMLPDVPFVDEPLIILLRDKLLRHPAVQAERAADWPEFLR